MRTNLYVGKGAMVPHTASGAVTAGDVVVRGVEIALAEVDIANGASGAVRRAGRATLAAASADSWSAGDQLYWNAGNQVLTSTASGNTKAGIAVSDKAALATTAEVILNGNAG